MLITELDLKEKIRVVENFPKPGISYKDITPLLLDPQSLDATHQLLYEYYQEKGITKICGIESRGFILGSMLAHKLCAGFVPIRKAGKLPFETTKVEYALEYGTDSIEIHSDSICENDTVLIHDDLLATGGTMEAAIKLVTAFKPRKILVNTIIELDFLNGREKLKNQVAEYYSLLRY